MEDNISISGKEYTLHENKTINVNSRDDTTSLYVKYHESEIQQNKIIIENSVKMIWTGIILLFIGLFFTLFTENNFYALLPGAFIDIFSGTMIYLVNKSSETKEKYFSE